jgi:hypothetical protein
MIQSSPLLVKATSKLHAVSTWLRMAGPSNWELKTAVSCCRREDHVGGPHARIRKKYSSAVLTLWVADHNSAAPITPRKTNNDGRNQDRRPDETNGGLLPVTKVSRMSRISFSGSQHRTAAGCSFFSENFLSWHSGAVKLSALCLTIVVD